MRPVAKNVERCRIFLNFLGKIALFVLNCRNLKILRDFRDFVSYISYGEVYALRDQRAGASPVAKEKPGFRLFCSIGCPVILDHFALFENLRDFCDFVSYIS